MSRTLFKPRFPSKPVEALRLGLKVLCPYGKQKPDLVPLHADGVLFPFDLKRYTIDASVDLNYLELAETIKLRMGCLPHGLSDISALHIKEVNSLQKASKEVCAMLILCNFLSHIQCICSGTSLHIRTDL